MHTDSIAVCHGRRYSEILIVEVIEYQISRVLLAVSQREAEQTHLLCSITKQVKYAQVSLAQVCKLDRTDRPVCYEQPYRNPEGKTAIG